MNRILMAMTIYIAKLIFHKNDLKDILLSITKEHMIVTCCPKDQEAWHSFGNMALSRTSHITDIHLFQAIRMTGRDISRIPINGTKFFQSVKKRNEKSRVIVTVNIAIWAQLRKTKDYSALVLPISVIEGCPFLKENLFPITDKHYWIWVLK